MLIGSVGSVACTWTVTRHRLLQCDAQYVQINNCCITTLKRTVWVVHTHPPIQCERHKLVLLSTSRTSSRVVHRLTHRIRRLHHTRHTRTRVSHTTSNTSRPYRRRILVCGDTDVDTGVH